MSNYRPAGYKPSYLEYAEMVLLALCYISHFMSWASLSINGSKVFSFVPFELFGSTFAFTLFVIIAIAIGMKFKGQFTGMTLLVITNMVVLIYASRQALKGSLATADYLGGLAGFANGISSVFGSLGSYNSGSIDTAVSQSASSGYVLVGGITFLLAACVLAQWILCGRRLATMHRNEIKSGYNMGMIGYGLVCFFALLIVFTYYDSIKREGFHFSREHIQSVYIMIVGVLVVLYMLAMFIVNAIVAILLKVLQERKESNMTMWSLVAAAVFAFIFGMLYVESKESILASPRNGINDFVSQTFENGVYWVMVTVGKCMAITATITCLLRAVYFHMFYTEETEETEVIDSTENSAEPSQETTQEVVAPAIEAADDESEEENSNDYKKYYIGGGIGVLLIALICFFTCSGKKGNDLLPVEKPAWEKFVVTTTDEVHFYKEASEYSPQLEVAREDLESDAIDMYFKWSDQPNKKGYDSFSYTLFKDNVLPVVAEEDGWYKVSISDNMAGTETCYISKSVCREVKPEPITPELLAHLTEYSGYKATYGLQTEGKYKNICFISIMTELDGSHIDAAVLKDGILINPMTKIIFTQGKESVNAPFEVVDDMLAYSSDMVQDNMLDTRNITTEANAELLFNLIPTSVSKQQEVSYYFPEVDRDHLVTFTQVLTGGNTSNNTESMNDQDNVLDINYVVDKNEEGYYGLFAEINNEKKDLDINGYAKLLILDQRDYDGDGIKEALIYEWGGGNSIEPPYIVYYDTTTESFKKAEGFQHPSEDPQISVEEWNGKPSFREDVGRRKDRYVFEDHEVKLAESIKPDVGKIVCTITTEQIFPSGGFETKTIHIDIDGDGVKEKVVLLHDESHAMDYGASMLLEDISGDDWCLPDFGQENLGVQGAKFSFLQSKTRNLPDILVEDAWLYKYNGEGSYEISE